MCDMTFQNPFWRLTEPRSSKNSPGVCVKALTKYGGWSSAITAWRNLKDFVVF